MANGPSCHVTTVTFHDDIGYFGLPTATTVSSAPKRRRPSNATSLSHDNSDHLLRVHRTTKRVKQQTHFLRVCSEDQQCAVAMEAWDPMTVIVSNNNCSRSITACETVSTDAAIGTFDSAICQNQYSDKNDRFVTQLKTDNHIGHDNGRTIEVAHRHESTDAIQERHTGKPFSNSCRKSLINRANSNILTHLFQRSILSHSKFRRQSIIRSARGRTKLLPLLERHWNACDTVQLSTVHSSHLQHGGEVCSLSFDIEGILLATGDDRGNVRIYDFDKVSCIDQKIRNETNRRMQAIKTREKELQLANRNNSTNDVSGLIPTTSVVEDTTTTSVANSNSHTHLTKKNSKMSMNEKSEGNDVLKKTRMLPSIDPALLPPVQSFQCRVRTGNRYSPRISALQWNPDNQDQLAVSFANQQEIHLYDLASSEIPLPFLRLCPSCKTQTSLTPLEGVSAMKFLSSSEQKECMSFTNLLTGGSYGTIKLWTIPISSRQQQALCHVSGKCAWSISAFGSKGEGVSELMVLPFSDPSIRKPLVLISGSASSLVLLDTGRCTRKAFSTTITPTVLSSWDLYPRISRELSKVDIDAKLPARRWMAVHRMVLLGYQCTYRSGWYRIGLVLKCGWVLILEINLASNRTVKFQNNSIKNDTVQKNHFDIRVHIIHRTPRIQCFNSSNEHVAILGGMALNYSLPDIPTPSMAAVCMPNSIWVGDVKAKQYTMPSKDKYLLCEQHGVVSSAMCSYLGGTVAKEEQLQHLGEGLILLDLSAPYERVNKESDRTSHENSSAKENSTALEDAAHYNRIYTRLPLTSGIPISLDIHPSGEWMILGYGMNGRQRTTKSLELFTLRKSSWE